MHARNDLCTATGNGPQAVWLRLLFSADRCCPRVSGALDAQLDEHRNAHIHTQSHTVCVVQEAYRVIKAGGEACLIGPVHPTFPVSRFFADAWMLFPTEQEYLDWFTAAGFEDVKITRIGPQWYRGVRRHGLIMGCSVTGRKPKVRSPAPSSTPPKPSRCTGLIGPE